VVLRRVDFRQKLVSDVADCAICRLDVSPVVTFGIDNEIIDGAQHSVATEICYQRRQRGAWGLSEANSRINGAKLVCANDRLYLRSDNIVVSELPWATGFEAVVLPVLRADVSLVDAGQADAARRLVCIPHALRAAAVRDAHVAGDLAIGPSGTTWSVGIFEEEQIAGLEGVPIGRFAHLPNLFGGTDAIWEWNTRIAEGRQNVERTIDVVDPIGRRLETIRHTSTFSGLQQHPVTNCGHEQENPQL